MSTRVVLASASPARLQVLRAAGIDPLVTVSQVDEDAVAAALDPTTTPHEVVTALARAKANDVAARISEPDAVVIGCDSMLLHDGQLTGKPHHADVAVAQWQRMRGSSAELLTGHCVIRVQDSKVVAQQSDWASTTVRFANIDDATIDAYVGTGEPLHVAGAFTLDSLGGWFIDGIDGDPSSVVGIGLPLTRRLLAAVGVDVTMLWQSIPSH